MYRTLQIEDVDAALRLSNAAGWNQTAADWQRMLLLEPDGCFAIDCEGRLAATATCIRYGEDIAWIGMVLTDPPFQRRGFARTLVKAALKHASGVRSVMLDASDEGRPLYLSLGFRDDQPVERWHREAPAGRALPLDREAFGADRSHVLRALSTGNCRPGTRARYLGPCIAPDAEIARFIIANCLATATSEPWFWDLLPRNVLAVNLARELGFTPVRRLTRMIFGEAPQRRDEWVYAIAGFEFG